MATMIDDCDGNEF